MSKNSRYKKLSHSIYSCDYHVVFCPKYRSKVLKDEVKESLKQIMYKLCREKDRVEVLELNIRKDHVHMLVSIPPKYSVSEIMGFIKGKVSNKHAKDIWKEIKRISAKELMESRILCKYSVELVYFCGHLKYKINCSLLQVILLISFKSFRAFVTNRAV